MDLKVQKLGQWKVLVPSVTRLDAYVAEDFKKLLDEALTDGTQNVVVDLSDIVFVDSSALGALVHCRRRLGEPGQMALVGAKEDVSAVLKLTRLDRVFLIADSVEDFCHSTA